MNFNLGASVGFRQWEFCFLIRDHESRLTIASATAIGNKQNPAFLDIGEARKNCSGNPAECHNLFALCRWRNLPVTLRFFWPNQLSIVSVKQLRVCMS
jgi:hypothetical protein